MARDEGKNVKASSTGANAGTLPNNDENQTPRQIVGRPEKNLSNKGDWLGKIAVVRDVVRCSDDVEGGRNSQPQKTERGRDNAVPAGGLTPLRMQQGYVRMRRTPRSGCTALAPLHRM